MKEAFIDWNPNPESTQRLEQITAVLEEFDGDNIKLTLRQLFYQLVTKNIIPNQQRAYKQLGELLSKARLSGLIDWRIIEDRVRQAERSTEWDTIAEYCDPWQFRLPRWSDQPNYVELWCEKDALSSVLAPITADLHAVLMVNRGYSSSSAMYESSKRIEKNANGKPAHIIYLGDFDPSGEDMVRDIRDRMETFGCDVDVVKLALNPDQVRRWKLPPNPAKMSDSRAAGFVDMHGSSSYEVDAIPPKDLQKMVRKSITDLMDMDAYEAIKAKEDELKDKLREAVEDLE